MKRNRPTCFRVIRCATKLDPPFTIKNILAPMSDSAPSSRLSEAEYLRLTTALIGGVEATLDRWLQGDVIDIDSARTGGLLEMSFPNGSKMILNTQPPLQEVWLAARAGGFHVRFQGGRWLDTKDGREFYAVLSICAGEQAGQALQFTAKQ